MKREHKRKSGKAGLELIEEASHQLRTAPAATLAVYYVGTIPFVLGLLYFWADMSRSPFADRHLAEAALAVSALYFWMKFCQVLFARRIRAQIAMTAMPEWNSRQFGRMALNQVIVQPSGLFLIPLSMVPALPFGWVYAFYQNCTALDDGQGSDLRTLLRKSWKQASLWPRQNHILLSFLLLFGVLILLNWLSVCMLTPQLLKTLFGVESVFTRSPEAMLNTTFLTAICGLTYLSIDPIVKVAYVLRSFYGESLQSGDDLRSELKQFAASTRPVAAALVLFVLGGMLSVHAAEAPSTPAPSSVSPTVQPAVSPPELDRAIDDTLRERKYTWRMPRDKVSETTEKGVIGKFVEKVFSMIRNAVRTAWHWLSELFKKLFQSKRTSPSAPVSGYGWIMSLHILLYVLVAAAVAGVVFLVIRVLRARRQAPEAVLSEAILPTPDVADENVGADQLPEDGWTRLARELLERGEFRLAMRAFYLASLAHLAQRNLISIARFKSNRDYESELRRRAHAIPNLLPVFDENMSMFERIWYGMHEVNHELVSQFAVNVDKIKGAG